MLTGGIQKFFFVLLLFVPVFVIYGQVPAVDLSITKSDIAFSKTELVEGEKFRVYASIHNYGSKDAKGAVTFFMGASPINEPQPISVKTQGVGDDVFVDTIAPLGEFNIRVLVTAEGESDQNLSNNDALSRLLKGLPDADKDLIADSRDNCPKDFNPEQLDQDQDGIGDVCDTTAVVPPPPPPPPPPSGGTGQAVSSPSANSQVSAPASSLETASPGNSVVPSEQQVAPAVETSAVSAPKAANGSASSPKKETNLAENTAESAPSDLEVVKELVNAVGGAEGSPLAILNDGDKAAIDYAQLNWNTFLFTAEVGATEANALRYHWNFGDSSQADTKDAQHSYNRSGKYKVTLEVKDAKGAVITTDIPIKVKFFHFGNRKLWFVIGGLILLAIGFVLLSQIPLFKSRDILEEFPKLEKEKKSPEESLPPVEAKTKPIETTKRAEGAPKSKKSSAADQFLEEELAALDKK
ncbi:MAG: PKD domain-containing protein [Parcubacteria group bacterium]|nr:PKD domain-containing protein [Parcubacteria group bacterium]